MRIPIPRTTRGLTRGLTLGLILLGAAMPVAAGTDPAPLEPAGAPVTTAPAPVPATGDGVAEEADVETRVYDLTGVVPVSSSQHRWAEVLPFRLPRNYTENPWEMEVWEDEDSLVDELMTMLVEIVAPDEFSYEYRELYNADDNTLVVVAPAAVHTATQQLIDGIAALSRRRAMLEVDVFRLGGGSGLGEAGSPSVLIEAPGTTRVSHHEIPLHVGRTHEQRSVHTTSIVRTWSSEIAQSIGISMPNVVEMETGVSWLLRLEDDHARGAYRLRLVQRFSEILGMGGGDYGAEMLVTLDGNVTTLRAAGHLDQPSVGVSTVATSRAVAVGDDTITVTAMETPSGTVRYATRYRLVSAEPPPQAIPLGPDGVVSLLGMDLSGTIWRPMDVPEIDRHRLWPADEERDEQEYSIKPIGFPSDEATSDFGLDRLHEVLWDRGGIHMFTRGALMIVAGSPDLATLVPETVAPFQSSASPASVDVLVTGRGRSGGPSRVLGRVVLPVDGAGSALALTGVASLALHTYDVDVAQNVSLPEPHTVGYLDGLSVRAEAVGGRDIAVDLLLHRLSDRESVDSNAEGIGELDRLSFDSVRLQPVLSRTGDAVTYRDVGSALADEMVIDIAVTITTP